MRKAEFLHLPAGGLGLSVRPVGIEVNIRSSASFQIGGVNPSFGIPPILLYSISLLNQLKPSFADPDKKAGKDSGFQIYHTPDREVCKLWCASSFSTSSTAYERRTTPIPTVKKIS